MEPDPIKAEYEAAGMVEQAAPLADPSVLPELIADRATFERAFADLRARGLERCVAYIVTDAIRRAAQDPAILGAVGAILGPGEPLVMWGPNIREDVPNQAYNWHVDMESWHWPTVTVAVGLRGCSAGNATRYLAGSQRLSHPPEPVPHDAVPPGGESLPLQTFRGFGDGRFYVFNARGWHCGDPRAAAGRTLLLMHYQRASERRIPQMRDYGRGLWFNRPAAYAAIPHDTAARRTMYRAPGQSWWSWALQQGRRRAPARLTP